MNSNVLEQIKSEYNLIKFVYTRVFLSVNFRHYS